MDSISPALTDTPFTFLYSCGYFYPIITQGHQNLGLSGSGPSVEGFKGVLSDLDGDLSPSKK